MNMASSMQDEQESADMELQTESDKPIGKTKRKQDDISPLDSTLIPDFKKQYITGDSSDESADENKEMLNGSSARVFNSKVAKTFKDPKFIAKITPTLLDLMIPVIDSCITKAVTAFQTSVVGPLLESNNKLLEQFEPQSKTIK